MGLSRQERAFLEEAVLERLNEGIRSSYHNWRAGGYEKRSKVMGNMAKYGTTFGQRLADARLGHRDIYKARGFRLWSGHRKDKRKDLGRYQARSEFLAKKARQHRNLAKIYSSR